MSAAIFLKSLNIGANSPLSNRRIFIRLKLTHVKCIQYALLFFSFLIKRRKLLTVNIISSHYNKFVIPIVIVKSKLYFFSLLGYLRDIHLLIRLSTIKDYIHVISKPIYYPLQKSQLLQHGYLFHPQHQFVLRKRKIIFQNGKSYRKLKPLHVDMAIKNRCLDLLKEFPQRIDVGILIWLIVGMLLLHGLISNTITCPNIVILQITRTTRGNALFISFFLISPTRGVF